jgi:hypothetical protein
MVGVIPCKPSSKIHVNGRRFTGAIKMVADKSMAAVEESAVKLWDPGIRRAHMTAKREKLIPDA